MKYLVDTDWVADYLKGKPDASQILSTLARDGIAISLMTLGELYEGIHYGRDPQAHERGLRLFLRQASVLTLNRAIMRRFAVVRGALRHRGQLIGDTDLLIGATALHPGLVLVTRNTRHFERIPHLPLYRV